VSGDYPEASDYRQMNLKKVMYMKSEDVVIAGILPVTTTC
jgi:hypothetical protein